MKLEDVIEQIENVSKAEIKQVVPTDCNELKERWKNQCKKGG